MSSRFTNAAAGAADEIPGRDGLVPKMRDKSPQPGAEGRGGLGVVEFSQHLLKEGCSTGQRRQHNGKHQAQKLHEKPGEAVMLFSFHKGCLLGENGDRKGYAEPIPFMRHWQ